MTASFKTVLVGIAYDTSRDDRPSAALSYALSLARASGAHITAEAAALKLAAPRSLVSDLAANLIASENKRLNDLAAAAATTVRGAAELAGVVSTVEARQLTYDEMVKRLVARARVHDVTVLDGEPTTLSTERGLIEAVLFESGRPLIVVPPTVNAFRGTRILVAWDGSARAARAVGDAMPLLRNAEHVEVVSVLGEKDLSATVPGAELAPHLSAHGVKVIVTNLPAINGDVAATLRRKAADGRFDLIVMGAFVHSWLRQVTLGGVTQSLLTACEEPLFLSY